MFSVTSIKKCFPDFEINPSNGVGYNSVIEANSSSEPGNRSEKEAGLGVQEWNVTIIVSFVVVIYTK